jgi:hypothetical protein
MRSYDSIGLRLRRSTNNAFIPDASIVSSDPSLGRSLGSYILNEGSRAAWVLFEHGVWEGETERSVRFEEVEHILPQSLTPEYKLLHFSPTLVFSNAPPFHLLCRGRDEGQNNHGWAVCLALRDIFTILKNQSSG